jgi:hypothetical protein
MTFGNKSDNSTILLSEADLVVPLARQEQCEQGL